MADTSNFNASITGQLTVLGTPKALDYYPMWQKATISGVATCCLNNKEIYSGIFASQFLVDIKPTCNCFTGCESNLVDPFLNITFFNRSALDVIQYSLVSSAIEYFSQTFSENNLKGDQLVVACAAFHLHELERPFLIMIHPNEINLLNFCKIQNWNYEVVGSSSYLTE